MMYGAQRFSVRSVVNSATLVKCIMIGYHDDRLQDT